MPKYIVDYLESVYTPALLINATGLGNNDERIGYLKGTYDVINRLKSLSKREDW